MVSRRSRDRLRQIGSTLFIAGLLLTGVHHARAQEEGGIIGQVRDESGAVLPGVTVTVSSPALQVRTMAAVTDRSGEYRITPLPIGTYSIEYSLPGFQG